MNQQDIYEKIQQLIIDGKITEAFDFLKNKKASDALTILESEFHELRNAEIKGTLDTNQIQIKKNQINEKLLSIAKGDLTDKKSITSKKNLWKILVPATILLLVGLNWWTKQNAMPECPTFPPNMSNNIMVLPFTNVGGEEILPHLLLIGDINRLAHNKQLPFFAKSNDAIHRISFDEAPKLAKNCQADLIIWGNYSNTDSLHLRIKYFFPKKPSWNNSTELMSLKGVSEMYRGSMSKNMKDAVLSLCGIMVMRDGNNNTLAKSWHKKVIHKEKIDNKILQALK